MSIAELEPPVAEAAIDKIAAPADATPEMLASMVAIPDPEMLQTYLLMRFGDAILRMSAAEQAELYQVDVSGASNTQPVFDPPIQVNWEILRGDAE